MTNLPRPPRPSLLALLGLLGLLSFAACREPGSDDDDAATTDGPSLDDRLRELADCDATDATQLLPWTGAAFDPATGALLAPLPAGHVEAVVNGWRRHDEHAVELRMEHGMRVLGDVLARDGLLGFEAVESDRCDISISHTLWRDEAALVAFVRGEAHAAAMAAAPQMHHAAAGIHWLNGELATPPDWHASVKHMAELRLAGAR